MQMYAVPNRFDLVDRSILLQHLPSSMALWLLCTQAVRLKWLAFGRSLVTVWRILVHGKGAGSTARARRGHRSRRC